MGNTHSASNKKRMTPSSRSKTPVENRSSEEGLDQKNNSDLEEEPVSLAEEIAVELEQQGAETAEAPRQADVHVGELQRMSMGELLELANRQKIEDAGGLKKQDLIFRILKEQVKLNGLMYGEGTLEILPDGFGFLRSPDYHYLSCPDDIYVSPSQIRRFGVF